MYDYLMGKRFGRLLILSLSNERSKYGHVQLECLCDCGSRYVGPACQIAKRRINSCGCQVKLHGKYRSTAKYYGDMPLRYLTRIRSNLCRGNKRKLKFNVTPKELWNLFLTQNRSCVLTGLPLRFFDRIEKTQTASLDRIDSNRDYSIDNVQWVHKDINIMKHAFPQDKFIEYCQLIVANTYPNSQSPKVDANLSNESLNTV